MCSKFLVEGVVNDAKVGTRCLKQPIRYLVRPFSPFPIRDVDENWIHESVGYALPSTRMDSRSRVVGIHTFFRKAIVQIGYNVGGIHDNNVTINQGWHFDTSINGLKRFVVRLEQPVNGLVSQLLVLQCHPHLAREWTECTVIKFYHDMTSCLRLRLGRSPYLRLAKQAERISQTDIVYETPPEKKRDRA